MLQARVAAAQGDAAGAADALRRAGMKAPCADAVLHATEFANVWGNEDVFRVAVWCGLRDLGVEPRSASSVGGSGAPARAAAPPTDHVAKLGEQNRTPVVNPRLAAADPRGTAGRLVDAVGIVTGASIDREHHRVVLRLEQTDIEVQQIGLRTAVVGHREEWRGPLASEMFLIPVTQVVETYSENFTPSGVALYAEAPFDEALLSQRYLHIVGKVAAHPLDTRAMRPIGRNGAIDDSAGVVNVVAAYVTPGTPRTWEQ
jgi:hypothetical protein